MKTVLLVSTVQATPSPGGTSLAFRGFFEGQAIDTVLLTDCPDAEEGDEVLVLVGIENIEDGVIHGHAKKWRRLS